MDASGTGCPCVREPGVKDKGHVQQEICQHAQAKLKLARQASFIRSVDAKQLGFVCSDRRKRMCQTQTEQNKRQIREGRRSVSTLWKMVNNAIVPKGTASAHSIKTL